MTEPDKIDELEITFRIAIRVGEQFTEYDAAATIPRSMSFVEPADEVAFAIEKLGRAVRRVVNAEYKVEKSKAKTAGEKDSDSTSAD